VAESIKKRVLIDLEVWVEQQNELERSQPPYAGRVCIACNATYDWYRLKHYVRPQPSAVWFVSNGKLTGYICDSVRCLMMAEKRLDSLTTRRHAKSPKLGIGTAAGGADGRITCKICGYRRRGSFQIAAKETKTITRQWVDHQGVERSHTYNRYWPRMPICSPCLVQLRKALSDPFIDIEASL
jgi:predicted RNA-binding protein YlxR (DUF448 family)